MVRMDPAAKERLAEAAERRKWSERATRGRTFRDLTPRLLLKPWRQEKGSAPDLIRAGEVRFQPAKEEERQSLLLTDRGPAFGPKRVERVPDLVNLPHMMVAAGKDLDGRLVKPLAADLRRYDALGARIVKLQRERRQLLADALGRGRPLTSDEAVALGKQVRDFAEAGYPRPESLAKRVKLPR